MAASPSGRTARHNLVINTAGEGFWGMLGGMITSSTVLVVLLRRYGASNVMIGAITAIEIGSTLLPQILGSYVFPSRAHRQHRLVCWHFFVMLPFLVVIAGICLAAPRLSPALVRWGVLSAYGCYMLGMGVVLAVWFDWISSVFPAGMRGRAMGTAFGVSAVLNFAGGVLAGRLLTMQDRLPVFSILYMAAALFGSASMLVFTRIDDSNTSLADSQPPLRLREMVGKFRHSLSTPNFRRFLAGRIMATAGFSIVPFVAVHFTSARGGNLSPALVVTLGASMPAGAALSNVVFGWIGDHHGHRWGMILGAALQMVAIGILLLVPARLGCALAYFAIGLCSGAASVSHYNMIFETCPHDHRLSHITIANLVVGGGVVFPLAAGLTVQFLGLTTLLAASLIVSGVALTWFLFVVKEPRHLAVRAE